MHSDSQRHSEGQALALRERAAFFFTVARGLSPRRGAIYETPYLNSPPPKTCRFWRELNRSPLKKVLDKFGFSFKIVITARIPIFMKS